MSKEILLETRDLKKNYGAVQAVKGVNLKIEKSEIIGLVGDNAAGKSTFIKMLSGAVAPSSGKILFRGEETELFTPADARKAGIETVYQQFALVDNLPIYANIFLGKLLNRKLFKFIPVLDKGKMEKLSWNVIKMMDIRFDSLMRNVSELSGGQRQAVAIARALMFNPSLLILDEPTSGLAVKEVGKIQDIIKGLKKEGISVIFISHRLESVFETTDRIVVLRQGLIVMDKPTKDVTSKDVVESMFGLEG